MHYSAKTGGFYDSAISDAIPSDAVKITADKYRELLAGQAAGKRIISDAEGQPILTDPPVYAPTYQEDLQTLNAEYQKDVEAFNKAFSLAILFDGVSEEAKKASIREQYNNRKQKYVSDMAALKTEHGV